jgi:heme A synthase
MCIGWERVALMMVVALWIGALRRFDRGAAARRWAWASLGFILAEAAVGAGLVLMRWVGEDASVARAASIAFHLALTFALLASLVLVAWFGSPRPRPAVTPRVPLATTALLVAAMIVLGMTGAITALGDTLFPASSLVGGIVQDVSRVSISLRVRLLHPFLALAVAAGVIVWADARRRSVLEVPAKWRLTLLRGTVLVQLAAGAANVMLLAPVWLQLAHLLLADTAWLLMIVCLAEGQMGREARAASTIS